MRAFFYVPAMLSAVVIGVSWRWIFGDYFGIINYFIERYGGTPINWLTTPGWAMLVVILASVWARAGYYMVMVSGWSPGDSGSVLRSRENRRRFSLAAVLADHPAAFETNQLGGSCALQH